MAHESERQDMSDHLPRDSKNYYLIGALFGVLVIVLAALGSVYLSKDKVAAASLQSKGKSEAIYHYQEKGVSQHKPGYKPGDIE